MTTYIRRIDTLYAACSPELGLVSYGVCRDEAINNLQEAAQGMEQAVKEGQGERHGK
jgi:hypothetical protein